jgi:hypothetical protein
MIMIEHGCPSMERETYIPGACHQQVVDAKKKGIRTLVPCW